MPLHEFTHVKAHHGLLATEVVGGKSLGQLRLPNSSGATEDEGGNWPVGVLQTCSTCDTDSAPLLLGAARQAKSQQSMTANLHERRRIHKQTGPISTARNHSARKLCKEVERKILLNVCPIAARE